MAIRPRSEPRASSQPSEGTRLRILTVGNMYPPHHAGGYEVMWQTAVRHARQLGHHVRVLTSEYHHSKDLQEEDQDVHRTLRWYWDLERYQFPELSPRERLALERANAAELDRHLDELRPDLVSWWSMGCMSLSLIERVRRTGIPAAFVVHDDWLVYGRRFDQWIRMWRGKRRLLAPLAERLFNVPTEVDIGGSGDFVFNSRYTLEGARRAGVPVDGARVVYPGIDESVQRTPTDHPWGWRLLYLGRIDPQKGIDTAVQALVHLPETASLTVWGTGNESYLREMEALIRRLGLEGRVHFRGWAGPAERLEAYGEADVVVFPVRWEEPFGLVPLEAMAQNRPVVSTLRGGTAEFLRADDNALVVEPDDPVALARQIRRLACDAELRDRLLRAGRQTAAGYTLECFAEETVAAMVQSVR